MDYRKIIKEIGRGKNHARDLDRDTARGLYAHMLNGEAVSYTHLDVYKRQCKIRSI